MNNIKTRILDKSEIENALSLVWDVFLEFEAPDYTKEGIDNFRRSVWDERYLKTLVTYGAFIGDTLVGVIATRKEGSHIALFFVNGKYQNNGIGRALIKLACADNKCDTITVNSSPFAEKIYKHLGFVNKGSEKEKDGIRYFPMMCDCKKIWIDSLTNKNATLACKACDRLCEISEKSDCCYEYMKYFFELLKNDDSYFKNRAIALISANAKWDKDNIINSKIYEYLIHITDIKPITARQLIKSLPEIANRKPQLKHIIVLALNEVDISRYNENMKPLIESDIIKSLNSINSDEDDDDDD